MARRPYHRARAEVIAQRRAIVLYLWRVGNKPREILRALEAAAPELLAGSAKPYALVWEAVRWARQAQMDEFQEAMARQAQVAADR